MAKRPRSGFFRRPTRGVDLVRLLETLLVCAVATILLVRTQLWLTNYPQLGGRGLHIAHLLWGGLFMLIALVALLAFVGPGVRRVAAVVGGIGLGLFIDELGKFITADNNYFFKPTAALIYIFFVIFFLAIRELGRRGRFSEREQLVNALELVKEAALGTMDEAQQRRALELLEHADQSDPLVPQVREMLEGASTRPVPPPSVGARAAARMRGLFDSLVAQPWFPTAVIAFFAVWAAASVVQIVTLVFFGDVDTGAAEVLRLGEQITSDPLGEGERTFIRTANLVASVVATGFALLGIFRIAQGRWVSAFLMFERALLVSIFFTQVFAFAHAQFAAAFGLLVNVLLFLAVRGVVARELGEDQPAAPVPAPAGGRASTT